MIPPRYVAVSGGFDPIHIGHLAYLHDAKELAVKRFGFDGKLMVILDSQEYLIKKGNGHPFYPTYEEREKVLLGLIWVDLVVPQIEVSTAKSLAYYRPMIFAKGGDRTKENLPAEEIEVCEKNNIEMVFGVGGYGKPQSSSWLIAGSRVFKPA